MTPVKLGVDVDGVLANCVRGAHRYHNLPLEHEPTCWDWLVFDHNLTPELNKKFWVNPPDNFWLRLEPLQGVYDLSNFLRDRHNIEPIFITARGGKRPGWQSSTWLGFYGLGQSQLIVSDKKGELAKVLNLDFYIDDKLENCLDVFAQTGRKPYLLDKSYNRHNTPDEALRYHRVSSVKDMLVDVENYTRIL